MSTSPHRTSDTLTSETDQLAHDPSADGEWALTDAVDAPFDQDAPYVQAPATTADEPGEPFGPVIGDVEADDAAYAEDSYEDASARPRTRSTVYASLPGMPGRGVVLLAGLSAGLIGGLDFALTGGLSYFFDLSFVVICLVAAMAVRGHDLFTTGVLPPLVFGLTMAVVAVVAPATFVEGGGLSKVFLTGLTAHAGALVFGYGTALVTVAGRAANHRRS